MGGVLIVNGERKALSFNGFKAYQNRLHKKPCFNSLSAISFDNVVGFFYAQFTGFAQIFTGEFVFF